MTETTRPPVDDAIEVSGKVDIYKKEEWWRAVLRYRSPGYDGERHALYLWHKEGGRWRRKQKYVIDDPETWQRDKEVIGSMVKTAPGNTTTGEYPTSDYLSVAQGETIYRTDEWWKAVTYIVKKGSYDTREVSVYLWQHDGGKWRRRQKYTTKAKRWDDDVRAIEKSLQGHGGEGWTPSSTGDGSGASHGDEVGILDALEDAVEF
jgi:hypothetical protein